MSSFGSRHNVNAFFMYVLACFGEVRLGKESVPIAVEALEGPRRTFILLPSIRAYEFNQVPYCSLVRLRCLLLFCQMVFDG